MHPEWQPLFSEVERVLVGRRALLERLAVALLTQGHVLIEGVPGVAKTLAVRALAKAIDLPFGRVQFTPDLLPSDLIGTQIYSPRDGTFTTRLGPIFAPILLADEINRAPAKVQSALLEAMEEQQVTIGERSHPLPRPFMVLATQNPLEQEGTYPLPEAQLDRFQMKLLVEPPNRDEEIAMLDRVGSVSATRDLAEIRPVLGGERILAMRDEVERIHVDARLKAYIVDLVQATRNPSAYGMADLANRIDAGASPRATLALLRTAQAKAFLEGRDYILPSDIQSLAYDILRHRLRPSYEAEAAQQSPDALVREIVTRLPTP